MQKPTEHSSEPQSERDNLLLATILGGCEQLTDSQILSAILREPDGIRAEIILKQSGNLSTLVHGGPLELQALGLHEEEIVRLMIQLEFTARVIAQRRLNCLSTLEATVRELRVRGEQRRRACVGLIAVDSQNRILIDRVLFEGTPEYCLVDVPEMLREVLRVGADGMVIHRWQPIPNDNVLANDRMLADRLRVAGSFLGVSLIDLIHVSPTQAWSARIHDGWSEV